ESVTEATSAHSPSLSKDAIGTSSNGPCPPRRRSKTKLAGLSSARAGRRTCPGLGQKRVHLGPQRPAGFPLVFRQRLQRRLIADAGQVRVGRPVLELPPHEGLRLGLAGFCLLGPEGQVGPQPVETLLPPAGFLLLVQRRLVVALGRSRRRGGAGGVVAVLSLHVFGQVVVGLEGLGIQPGGWTEL